jgi:nitrate/nitrite transport system permease protein
VRWRAYLLSVALLAVLLLVWHGLAAPSAPSARGAAAPSEYDALVAGADQTARVPSPGAVLALTARHLAHPFYDHGPND